MDAVSETTSLAETVDEPVGARGRRGRLPWLVMSAAALVVALLAVAVLRPADNNPLSAQNRPAPDFTMPLFGGGAVHLAALRGKTVVVNFWWSGCPPCVQEAPILERQWRVWQGHGVVFLGIDEIDGPNAATARRFLSQYGVTYPNGWDPGDVDIQYGTTGQPETYIVAPNGRIRTKYVAGFPDDQTLARLIADARA